MKHLGLIAAMLLAAAVSLALCSCANDSPDPAAQTTATTQAQTSEDMTTAGEEAVTTETSATGESLTTVAEETETPETKTTEESPAAEATTATEEAPAKETEGDELPTAETPAEIDAESFPYETYELSGDYSSPDVEAAVTQSYAQGVKYTLVNNSDKDLYIIGSASIHAYIDGEWVGVMFSDTVTDPLEMIIIEPGAQREFVTGVFNIPNGLYRVAQQYLVGSEDGESRYACAEFVYSSAAQPDDLPGAEVSDEQEQPAEEGSFPYDTTQTESRLADAAEISGITMTTDGYTGGDSVAFTIKNGSSDPITLDRETYVQVLLDGEWLTVLFPMDHDLPIEYTTLEAGSELTLGADCMELPSGEYRIIQGYTLSDSTVGCARCEFEID